LSVKFLSHHFVIISFRKRYENLGEWVKTFFRLSNEKERKRAYWAEGQARILHSRLLKKYPHLKEDSDWVLEYCRKRCTPIDPNPNVEKLMEENS